MVEGRTTKGRKSFSKKEIFLTKQIIFDRLTFRCFVFKPNIFEIISLTIPPLFWGPSASSPENSSYAPVSMTVGGKGGGDRYPVEDPHSKSLGSTRHHLLRPTQQNDTPTHCRHVLAMTYNQRNHAARVQRKRARRRRRGREAKTNNS